MLLPCNGFKLWFVEAIRSDWSPGCGVKDRNKEKRMEIIDLRGIIIHLLRGCLEPKFYNTCEDGWRA
ncbi:hypothetical protein K1719_026513 [Acacia pycnantha]|nr:hypothetical protein K1719_026513 [Acacia pycnantha]